MHSQLMPNEESPFLTYIEEEQPGRYSGLRTAKCCVLVHLLTSLDQTFELEQAFMKYVLNPLKDGRNNAADDRCFRVRYFALDYSKLKIKKASTRLAFSINWILLQKLY